jgi:acetoin utilization deacetylase AcuC-like enzyme
MRTALITHQACLDHYTAADHPECPKRLLAVLQALEADGFTPLLRVIAPRATLRQLARAHDAEYVAAILRIRPAQGEIVRLDPDTVMSADSAEAALRAAGGAIAAVDLVMRSRVDAVFVAVRPPGHHAGYARAMGFCLFNNAAIAAHHARARWGLRRVAVADFDVHHGNGTQAMFAEDPDLFYGSSHQEPCYPGTGRAWENGVADNIVNAPLIPRSTGTHFRTAWSEVILPALDKFAPELLIVSAGFDAHRADPLAHLRLEAMDFAWITAELVRIAHKHAGGRIVSLLEGGYNLDALAESAAAHVRTLMEG